MINEMINIIYGIISGIISGMGMGGGTILILLLTCFQSMDQKIAQATNLIFFIPTSIIATVINIKNKNIDYKIAAYIIISGVIFAIIGSSIAIRIDVSTLRKIFAGFLICIAVYETYDIVKNKKDKNEK